MKEWKKRCLELALTTNKSWRNIANTVGKPKSTVSDFLRKALKKEGLQFVERKPKFLFLDIETSMIQAYVWGLWKQNISIDKIIRDWFMICFSAKWLGEEEILHDGLQNYPSSTIEEAEYEIIKYIWELLDQADVICAYNGIRFDKKKVNAKFFEHGFPEPSPYKIVDPMLIVKGNFALTSNKLDYVAKIIGRDGKKETNIQLWIDCMNREKEALDYMQFYCDGDIEELEGVYHAVKHWDKSHPNMSLYYDDNTKRCNTCGSDDLTKLDTTANTYVSAFSAYRCECCGKILRDRVNTLEKEKRKSLFMNVR